MGVAVTVYALGPGGAVAQETREYTSSTSVGEILASYPGRDLVARHQVMVRAAVVGARFGVGVGWEDTAKEVKRKILERTELAVEYQVISVDGVVLDDDARVLSSVSDAARPALDLDVRGAPEGLEMAFYDRLKRVVETGRRVERLAPASTLAHIVGARDDDGRLFLQLFAVTSSAPAIQLALPFTDHTVPVDIAGDDMTVGDLRDVVARERGCERASVRLVFGGRVLGVDGKKLTELGIMDESVVTLRPPPPAPTPPPPPPQV